MAVSKKHIYRLKTGEEIRWKGNHHGFVLVYAGRNQYGQRVYEIRKPSVDERRAMVLSYIRENDGKPVKIHWLAKKLGVSDRTIQMDLRRYEKMHLITSTPSNGNEGRENGYIYHIISRSKLGVGTIYTIKTLYQMSNPIGYRTWQWEDYKMTAGMNYYDLEFLHDELDELKEEQKEKRLKFGEKKFKEDLKKRRTKNADIEM